MVDSFRHKRSHQPGLSWEKARTRELFALYRNQNDLQARDELVEMYMSLVRYLASKFRNRGELLDDLVQVGTIGLIKAVDRFDVDRHLEFTTYATPTILGEIKRHFRDKGWAVKVPRRMQELSARVNKAVEYLSCSLERSPTISEIASYLEVSSEEVLEAFDASEAYSTMSYDSTDSDNSDLDSYTILDRVGDEDRGMVALENREVLDQALETLDDEAREIIRLRFYEERTQTEIAQTLNISQMQVSRVLRKSLEQLRRELTKD